MQYLRRMSFWAAIAMWSLAVCLWVEGTSQTAHVIARAIPVSASVFNPYWAGFVDTEDGPFTGAQASWSVPAAGCRAASASNATTYVWVGEGGYLRGLLSPLIQVGTASDCVTGVPRYHAFYEWYPGIYATDFPVTIAPGDTVTARLTQPQTNYWLLSIRDDTTGKEAGMVTLFQADVYSADFVVERPTVCSFAGCSQLALNRFRSVNFQNIRAWAYGGRTLTQLNDPVPIALIDPDSNHLLALPGHLDTSSRALSVIWKRSS